MISRITRQEKGLSVVSILSKGKVEVCTVEYCFGGDMSWARVKKR